MAYGRQIQDLEVGDKIVLDGQDVRWYLEFCIKPPHVWRAGSPDGNVAVLKFAETSDEDTAQLRAEFELNRRLSGLWTAKLVDSSFYDLNSEVSPGILWPLQWIATQYLRYRTLYDFVYDQGVLEGPRAVNFARSLWEAVAEFRTCGVAHRDLSWSNVILDLDDFHPRILDLGIGQAAEQSSESKVAPEFTPGFGAAEQVTLTQDIDFHADIWGWGATVYFAVTGAPLFRGTTNSYAWHIAERTPVPLDDVPPDFIDALRIALAYDVADRSPDQIGSCLPATEAEREVAALRERNAAYAKQKADLEAERDDIFTVLNVARGAADASAAHAKRAEDLGSAAAEKEREIASLRREMSDTQARLARAQKTLDESNRGADDPKRLSDAEAKATRASRERDAAVQRADNSQRVADRERKRADSYAADLESRPQRQLVFRRPQRPLSAERLNSVELATANATIARLTRDNERQQSRANRAEQAADKKMSSQYSSRLAETRRNAEKHKEETEAANRKAESSRCVVRRELERAVAAEVRLRKLEGESTSDVKVPNRVRPRWRTAGVVLALVASGVLGAGLRQFVGHFGSATASSTRHCTAAAAYRLAGLS
jgi:serine/threonine protein kinase